VITSEKKRIVGKKINATTAPWDHNIFNAYTKLSKHCCECAEMKFSTQVPVARKTGTIDKNPNHTDTVSEYSALQNPILKSYFHQCRVVG
jgi:hypothetical protein